MGNTRELLDSPVFVRRTLDGLLYFSDQGFPLLYDEAMALLEQLKSTYEQHSPESWDAAVQQEIEKRMNRVPVPTFKPQRDTHGYVYLIQQVGGEHFKIGLTANPDRRLSEFVVKLPFKIEPICLIKTRNMYELEAELHERFASKRVDGEWFSLAPEDVEYIKGLAS